MGAGVRSRWAELRGIGLGIVAAVACLVPGGPHEGTVELLRQAPAFVLELLRSLPGLRRWKSVRIEPDDGSLGAPQPPELRADRVVVLVHGRQRVGLIVEVQSTRDARKRLAWPAYAASYRLRHGIPVVLLVIALDRQVARWAKRPIELGGGNVFVPLVVGIDDVDEIVDPEVACSHPERAVLSSILHRKDARAAEVAYAAAIAADGLATDRAAAYLDIIFAALDPARRRELLELMRASGHQPISDWARHHFQRGIDQGREAGREEGRREQMAEALLEVLATRELDLPPDAVDRIRACDDLGTLRRWLKNAVTADAVADLFRD